MNRDALTARDVPDDRLAHDRVAAAGAVDQQVVGALDFDAVVAAQQALHGVDHDARLAGGLLELLRRQESREHLLHRDLAVAERHEQVVEARAGAELGELQLTLFEETTEQLLIQPTYIVDYPAIVSPLARRNDANPEITDRFELYVTGREMANGFSELNDPEDQAARFEEQARAKAAGDEEAMYYDADYIRALEHGLPPTAGCGIGIDRLVMLFTNSPSIRDVILFPHLRPEA